MKNKILLTLSTLAVILVLAIGCGTTKQPEPIDISGNYGYIDFGLEHWRDVPPMPDGYIPVEVIKDWLLNDSPFTFIDTTIIGFSKPYYKPLNPYITTPMIQRDQTDKTPYNPPFYTCEDYTQAVIGMFNQNVNTANMPIFKITILRNTAEVHPHTCIAFWYTGKLWYFEPMSDYWGDLPSDWTLIAISG